MERLNPIIPVGSSLIRFDQPLDTPLDNSNSMPTCNNCNTRKASEHNEPKYQGLCYTCQSISSMLKSMEIGFANVEGLGKAPQGKVICIDWKYVDAPL